MREAPILELDTWNLELRTKPMRAVWSFWSRPFEARKNFGWNRPLHHLLAWGLSLRVASRHYPETVLITDSAGKRLLVDQLGLPFTQVSTELDRLQGADADWWVLGKLVAYNIQDRPFLHLDTDVFLWNPLPPRLLQAQLFAQHPEYPGAHPTHCFGGPHEIEQSFAAVGLELPAEWHWARSQDDAFFPQENCGIFGGTNIEFIRYYSGLSLDLVLNPKYRPAWARLGDKRPYTVIVEQFMLAACAAYHRFHPTSPFRGLKIQHLFKGGWEAFDHQHSTKRGYTHLIGGTKSNPSVARRIEERVKREDLAFYQQCERLAS
jgi:hypothetical protein